MRARRANRSTPWLVAAVALVLGATAWLLLPEREEPASPETAVMRAPESGARTSATRTAGSAPLPAAVRPPPLPATAMPPRSAPEAPARSDTASSPRPSPAEPGQEPSEALHDRVQSLRSLEYRSMSEAIDRSPPSGEGHSEEEVARAAAVRERIRELRRLQLEQAVREGEMPGSDPR